MIIDIFRKASFLRWATEGAAQTSLRSRFLRVFTWGPNLLTKLDGATDNAYVESLPACRVLLPNSRLGCESGCGVRRDGFRCVVS